MSFDRSSRFEIYPRQVHRGEDGGEDTVATGDFGWRFRGEDGELQAVSVGGYVDRRSARFAVLSFAKEVQVVAHPVEIIDVDPEE